MFIHSLADEETANGMYTQHVLCSHKYISLHERISKKVFMMYLILMAYVQY